METRNQGEPEAFLVVHYVDLGVSDFKVDGKIVSDGRAESEILSQHFSGIFTKEDPTTIPAVGTEPKPAIGPLIVTIPGVMKPVARVRYLRDS